MTRSIVVEDLTESAGRRASALETTRDFDAICPVCEDLPCTCADPAAETEEQLAERRSYRSLRDTPAGQAAALALQAYRETQASRPAARAGIICRTPRQRRMFAKSNAQAQEGN